MNSITKQRIREQLDVAQNLNPATSDPNNSIENIKVGSCFTYQGLHYVVKDKITYTELKKKRTKLGSSWVEYEIYCVNTGETNYMEIEIDDSVIIYFTNEVGLALSDFNLNKSKLYSILDEEEPLNSIPYYDDYKFRIDRPGREPEDGFVIEFEDNSNWISVEGWFKDAEDKDPSQFEVSKGVKVSKPYFQVLYL